MIVAKTPAALEQMARAGAVVARTHDELLAAVRPGVTTVDLDRIAERVIRGHGGLPSFKGYRGFPASICVSRNEQVLHGVPSATVLEHGDVVSIDCGAVVAGFHGDAAVTVVVGGHDAAGPHARGLIDATRTALWDAIARCHTGAHVGDLGAAIASVAAAGRYGVVHEYVGHGVGRALHEESPVPNHGTPGSGTTLTGGMVLAIEPMFTLGSPDTRTDADTWTVVTADGPLAAHWEHTVALTPDGPWVLTARGHEPARPPAVRTG